MIRKRKKLSTKRLKFLAKICAFLILLSLGAWGAKTIIDTGFLKAEIKWHIDTELPMTQIMLEKIIHPLIKNEYQLNTNEIQQALENQPWIAKVSITAEPLFFNRIKINIDARQIAMRWENIDCKTNDEPNCTGYISKNGTLFIPKEMTVSDAVLARTKIDQKTVSQLYQNYQEYQKITKKIPIKSFTKTHIERLTFEPNVTVILGYQQQQQRLARFLKVYQELKKKISRKKLNQATFDMRYPKGFTLKYSTE
ncbi:hypothetical protein MS2017_0576 [Bathymodiolus thermophilus thioautotrophic gill symbiont]|uniref:Cell division protein FtsQ/DivIB C-terminal domain-containing protein n=1 Tax=Bathymodiolus thermophilus thioautotrophic gill symbiont TaxID=2360 RepID=A0A3G3ILE8_9GAMM|nr:cell division protein FtsQ/DivIB [Bathymodiolus thermophilus thioautotrophic gill symbiont]AYQ56312.1 hypothetical protein MS2017_0576 [Bathymodiolus thermophilus thioautotrophic gill symbiont]